MYTLGMINPSWDETFDFPWKKQPLKESETTEWTEKGYQVRSFSGWMYDNKNPMPDWVHEIGNNFPKLQDKTYVIYKMETTEIMPVHVDHYETYMRLFNVERKDIRRVIVFLKNWESGHYFEIANRGLVNWRKGDYVEWTADEPHAASNIGLTPRYTLQITGHV